MISVTRNSHMPSEEEFFCCSMSAKWCRSSGLAMALSTAVAWLSLNGASKIVLRLNLVVVVGFPGYDRGLVEIKGWRWRRGLPLQPGRAPRIRIGDRAVAQRP